MLPTGLPDKHWSENYGNYRANLFAMGKVFQYVIDKSMEDGDLENAADASFGHSIVSYRLGDLKEGSSFMYMGCLLSHAGIALAIEGITPNPADLDLPAEQFAFTLPPYLIDQKTYPLHSPTIKYEENDKRSRHRDSIISSVASAEAAINSDYILGPSDKNLILSNAIHDIATCIADYMPHFEYSRGLLGLARQIASQLEINADEESTLTAFSANKQILSMCLYVEGSTIFALAQTIFTFSEVKDGPFSSVIGSESNAQINAAKNAMTAKGRSAAAVPIKNAWELLLNGNSPDKSDHSKPFPQRSHTSRDTQDKAFINLKNAKQFTLSKDAAKLIQILNEE
jgi:hypothetical protein